MNCKSCVHWHRMEYLNYIPEFPQGRCSNPNLVSNGGIKSSFGAELSCYEGCSPCLLTGEDFGCIGYDEKSD